MPRQEQGPSFMCVLIRKIIATTRRYETLRDATRRYKLPKPVTEIKERRTMQVAFIETTEAWRFDIASVSLVVQMYSAMHVPESMFRVPSRLPHGFHTAGSWS